jgi:hypothetical protein
MDTQEYEITWTGDVFVHNADTYVGQRIKYLGDAGNVLVGDYTPGDTFTYVTTVPGTSTTSTANFHVHLTQAQAGVDPIDLSAAGTVSLGGDCAIPTQPAGAISTSTDNFGQVDCDAKTIEATVTTWRTDYVWDAESSAWVLSTDWHDAHWVSAEQQSVPATDAQLADCAAVVTPPTTEPTPSPTTAPVVTPVTPVEHVALASDTGTLADTGSDLSVAWIITGIGGALAGAILMIAAAARRRRTE